MVTTTELLQTLPLLCMVTTTELLLPPPGPRMVLQALLVLLLLLSTLVTTILLVLLLLLSTLVTTILLVLLLLLSTLVTTILLPPPGSRMVLQALLVITKFLLQAMLLRLLPETRWRQPSLVWGWTPGPVWIFLVVQPQPFSRQALLLQHLLFSMALVSLRVTREATVCLLTSLQQALLSLLPIFTLVSVV